MSKNEVEKIKELARMYYLNGDTQKLVAEKVGKSRVTINKWVAEGGWDAMRVAKTITRKEIVTKMMQEANKKLEEGKLTFDEMSKLAASIDKIDRQTNAITIYEVMTAYNEWLVVRMGVDKELTAELVRVMNYYQDVFLSEHVSKNSFV
ncbi:terminase [Bacteroides acidifaciens]|uniref:terminase n=1 Tax=Bacteroides acidifaciens TaxID=85831 RepID=UPI0025583151|nr:terminase [Bacteroides acidifaciens]